MGILEFQVVSKFTHTIRAPAPTDNEPILAQQQWALWLQKGCGNARTLGIDQARLNCNVIFNYLGSKEDKEFIIVTTLVIGSNR